ncbi:hypothetical protein [Pseudothauera lacus]|uniref:Uncharacterized protein n=1 Tax=Pseudothauera lacus TaxID=2136175 RepID=A0A2T4IIM4_9RHOO|nr:hypothetical protein [Pseudothauera lacus]PTD97625.1 hypothetical protein C8261_02815 [Pseudothauera lacus]
MMPADTSPLPSSAGLAVRRRTRLAGCALAALVLGGGLLTFADGRNRAQHAERAHIEAEAALAQAQDRLQLAERQVMLAETGSALRIRMQSLGLTPAHWAERRMAIRDQSLPREDANEVLLGTSQGRGRLFVAEAFELSVTRFDEGLFHAPESGANPLRMSLRGTVLFRAGEPQ